MPLTETLSSKRPHLQGVKHVVCSVTAVVSSQPDASALATIEQEDSVRILLAVESGSRAWGFPSRGSDYGVRFIFIRPLADHLGISPPRDVIERPIDAELDLGGWDLRKTLGLMVRSNAVVFEWLSSPVVYRCEPAVVTALNDLWRIATNLPALAYHYDRLARGAWSAGEDAIRLKAYFYALRPALSLIQALLPRKAAAAEADTISRQPALERFLADVLTHTVPRPGAWDREPARITADGLFRSLVLER